MELPRRDCLRYRILGPAIRHLTHEFFLLVALICFTTSSLQTFYPESFGTWGDFAYLSISSLWLARHLIIRWLCTGDADTTRSPSLSGLVTIWITSHFMAGQYCDRPSQQYLATQLGTSHADDGRIVTRISSFFPPSILFAWQLIRVRLWFPLLSFQEKVWGFLGIFRPSFFKRISSRMSLSSSAALGVNQAYSYWSGFWGMYGFSFQALLPFVVTLFYALFLVLDTEEIEETFALTMNTRNPEEEAKELQPFGAYRKLRKPTLLWVFVMLSMCSTLLTILTYGRILLPIPDLIAGSNVLKALRIEARTHIAPQATKAPKAKAQRENADNLGAEQYKSTVNENRFRLICKIGFIRLLESIFVCIWLPKRAAICRFADHCPDGLSLAGLSKVLHPVGITSPLRPDAFHESQLLHTNCSSAETLLITFSVIICTVSILLAQAATLSRSYLGIMGYVTGGWTHVDNSDPSIFGTTLSQWDPRKKYKKGDLIAEHIQGFKKPIIYRATTNSPEGRPLDIFLRATHDLFRNEMGHPATSHLITSASKAQLTMAFLTFALIFIHAAFGYGYNNLLWTLVANLIGSFGVLNTAQPNYSEIAILANEISGT